uniref:Reverse transcriptase domain-containing protein n=1 Tax=Micrurus corallinus TaxID=54390 RepID=A0A2D4F0B4_MICCO
MDYLETNNTLPVQQKGNKRRSRGTQDQLLIDKMILENCKNRKTNLNMVWIHYKKAFDSLPHSWIIKCLETTGISKNITSFTEKAMKQWRIQLVVGNENYGVVNIKSGIFQGDSLSPLLFIIAMISLSVIFKKMKLGYQTAKDT